MGDRLNILITGASGFLGTHIVESAVKKKINVFALVRNTSDTSNLPNQVSLLKGDIRNYKDIVNVIKELKESDIQMDYVIHAAAVTKSNRKEEFEETNFGGTRNLFAALQTENYLPKKTVFISSLAACGPAQKNETIKDYFRTPVTLYGKSKLKAEAYILSSVQIPYLIIRPTAVYGPGEKDLFSIFKMINKHINPVLGFNEQQLTFIYVKDLAEVVLKAATSAKENKVYFATDGKVYGKNTLSREIAYSLGKKTIDLNLPMPLVKVIAYVAEHMASLAGKVSPLSIEKCKELTAESWNCDPTVLFKDINFTPKYNLRRGIEETTKWYKQHKWI